MGACPKHKASKMSQRKHRLHYRAPKVTIAKCPHCFEPKLSHTICPACGYYGKGVKVLDIEKA